MSKLVLHIGTHKTGTTALQHTFSDNRALLADHGIIYPEIGRTHAHYCLATPWLDLPKVHQLPVVAKHLWGTVRAAGAHHAWKKLAQDYGRSDKTVILSAEAFCRARPQKVDMVELRKLMEGFDEVEILCVLRDQIGFLQSVYLEMSKPAQPPALKAYIQAAFNQHMAGQLWLDYNVLYNHILTGFAPQEVHFVSFDDVRRHPGNIQGVVLDHLGGGLSAADLTPVIGDKANISSEPLAVMVANNIANPKVAPSDLIALADQTLRSMIGPDERTSVLTRPEAERLCKIYTPLNQKLETRIRKVQPDFTMPALAVDDSRFYRDQMPTQFWAKMARAVYRK